MENQEDYLSVKSAAEVAINYVKDLYASSDLKDLMLEEVEFSERTNQWLITVGFSVPETKEETPALFMPTQRSRGLSRRYKVVNIDAATGTPVSMKIRSI